MTASLPLNTFARNPRRALRHLPPEGLLLTRPGEPDLRLALDTAGTEPATSESATPAAATPAAAPAPTATPAPAPAQSAAPAEAVPTPAAPDRERDDLAGDDLGRAALTLLTPDAFTQLLLTQQPWLGTIPHAVRRQALAEIEQARTTGGPDAIHTALDHWHEHTAAFRN